MDTILDLECLYHRNRNRIKELGEVFTPESYVEDMLDLLGKDKRGIWSDEEITFFEPCSGHGNIVLSVYKRRLAGIYKKAISKGLTTKVSEAPYYAVANALNTLWAIDIDPKNIENCRSRVLATTLEFLKEKLGLKSDHILIEKKREFFAHALSAIRWHIDENETLSALSNQEDAKSSANLTKSGRKWFSQNGHYPMDFDLTWMNFYEFCENSNTVPLEYERSVRFIDSLMSGRIRGFEDFEFAKVIIEIGKSQNSPRKPIESLTVGA